MIDPHPDLTPSVIFGLGWLYLLLALMNGAWTVRVFREATHFKNPFGGSEIPWSGVWGLYSALLAMIAIAHLTGYSDPAGFQLRLPEWFRDPVNRNFSDPVTYFVVSIALFVLLIWLRRWFVKPTVGWILLNLSLLFLAVSLTDYDFRQIVGKPDNVPIVGMLYIVGFFTWLYFARAVENDDRIAEGRPVREAENNEKVLVWPDLVYTELICMVALTAFLIIWGIALQAPLEEPASSAKTPNPSKAPWYFLGLQEMLVYYDPWLAGVVFPSVIVVGLMAIPFIDFNKKGNGYYTFEDRKFSVSVFMLGFLPLWIGMIVLGTFLRGPNWNFFGIYEFWDVHKLEALNNVNLSEMFWIDTLRMPLPRPDMSASGLSQLGTILLRESPGILLTVFYLAAMPLLLALTVFRSYFQRMGFIRYMVFANLVLLMAALPIKMVMRWVWSLKYIIAIPEYFLNV